MPHNLPFSCFLKTLVSLSTIRFIQLLIDHPADIQRMYGKRKVIAKRTPLFPSSPDSGVASKAGISTSMAGTSTSSTLPATISTNDQELGDVLSTPAATEGETATETETEPETTTTEAEVEEQIQTEMDTQAQYTLPGRHPVQKRVQPSTPKLNSNSKSRHQPQLSISSVSSGVGARVGEYAYSNNRKKRGMSQHDLLNKYFRRDAVVLRNVDLLRYVVVFAFFTLHQLTTFYTEQTTQCWSSSYSTLSFSPSFPLLHSHSPIPLSFGCTFCMP